MALGLTRFSDFTDGMTAAKREPKKLDILGKSFTDPISRSTSNRNKKNARSQAERSQRQYANGYKMALMDMLYLSQAEQDEMMMSDMMADPYGGFGGGAGYATPDMLDGLPPEMDPYAQPGIAGVF